MLKRIHWPLWQQPLWSLRPHARLIASGSNTPPQTHERSHGSVAQNDKAVRELRRLYDSGTLDGDVYRDTRHTRNIAREPNHNIDLKVADPWIDLTSHIPSGELGVDYVRETMVAFHNQLRTLPTEFAQRRIREVGLGQQTLEWLWNLDEDMMVACGRDFVLLRFLAHYIVAEGREEYFWELLKIKTPNAEPTSNAATLGQLRNRYSWVGRLLGDIGRIQLARDLDGSADAAILMYMKFVNMREKTRFISGGAIHNAIGKRLTTNFTSTASPELFDKFMAVTFSERKRKYGAFDFDKSIALLVHPSRPDPDPLLKHFKSIEHKAGAREFHPKSVGNASFMKRLARHLSVVLRRQSRKEDAAWAARFADRLEEILVTISRRQRPSQSKRPAASTHGREAVDSETPPGDLMFLLRKRQQ